MTSDKVWRWSTMALLFALGVSIAIKCGNGLASHGRTGPDTVVTTRLVTLPPDTVYVDRLKAKVVYVPLAVVDSLGDTTYIHDTVLTTRPFVASIDTIIGCAEIRLSYRFPEQTFDSVYFRSCPDTLFVSDTTITNTVGPTFWDRAGDIGIGVAAGILIVFGIELVSR